LLNGKKGACEYRERCAFAGERELAMNFRSSAISCFLLGLLALAVPASADIISDSLIVTDASGAILFSVSATEAQEGANGSGFIYIITDSTIIDLNQIGNPTQVLDSGGQISDVFGIAFGIPGCSGDFCLGFASGTENDPVPYPGSPNTVFGSPGESFDATIYLDPSLQAAGDHATFTSEADVPEPSSIILLLTMVSATALYVRKRLRVV
jgi:hypothetical protein